MILVTGAAGFIGFSLCKKLLKNKNNEIIGLDNLNSYYSVKLKKERIKLLIADVLKTYGDNRKVKKIVKRLKFTNYDLGVQNTVKWYKKNKHLF